MTGSVEGSWNYQLSTEFGVMDGSLELQQSDAKVTGAFVNMGKAHSIYDGSVVDGELAFNTTMRTQSAAMMLRVEATVDGDTMTGMFMTPLGDSPFTAERSVVPAP